LHKHFEYSVSRKHAFFADLKGEQEFRRALTALIDSPVRIIYTFNRSTVISVRTNAKGIKSLRLQHAFRAADFKTMQALAFFVDGKEFDNKIIDRFLSKKQDLVKFFSRPRAEMQSIVYKGKFKDLEKALKKVTADYDIPLKGIRIAWSKPGKIQGKRRSIRFGSFSAQRSLIRIHPSLDSPEIPDYFVEFVVYHELLHALFPPKLAKNGGRRRVHTPEFRAMERRFREYRQAAEFEKKFISKHLG
jgi:hypothetical protein